MLFRSVLVACNVNESILEKLPKDYDHSIDVTNAPKSRSCTLCSMMAKNTIISTSVCDDETAAPSAMPSAAT